MLTGVLGVLVFLAVGLALFFMSGKSEATGKLAAAQKQIAEANEAAKKAAARAEDLDRKLTRELARDVKEVKEQKDPKEGGKDKQKGKPKGAKEAAPAVEGPGVPQLQAAIKHLEEENRRFKETLERTAARDTGAENRLKATYENQIRGLQTELEAKGREVEGKAREIEDARREAEVMRTEIATAEKSRRDRMVDELRASAKSEKSDVDDAYQTQVERLVAKYEDFRHKLMESERDRRITQRRAEANHRAYYITLLQLDAAQDRIYTLEHGEAPGARKKRLLATRGAEGMALPVPREVGDDVDLDAEEAAIQRNEQLEGDGAEGGARPADGAPAEGQRGRDNRGGRDRDNRGGRDTRDNRGGRDTRDRGGRPPQAEAEKVAERVEEEPAGEPFVPPTVVRSPEEAETHRRDESVRRRPGPARTPVEKPAEPQYVSKVVDQPRPAAPVRAPVAELEPVKAPEPVVVAEPEPVKAPEPVVVAEPEPVKAPVSVTVAAAPVEDDGLASLTAPAAAKPTPVVAAPVEAAVSVEAVSVEAAPVETVRPPVAPVAAVRPADDGLASLTSTSSSAAASAPATAAVDRAAAAKAIAARIAARAAAAKQPKPDEPG